MMNKNETHQQPDDSRNKPAGSDAGAFAAPAQNVNLHRTNEVKKTSAAPQTGEIVIFVSLIVVLICLFAWRKSRIFLDAHSGSVSAIATIAIMVLTAFYVFYARSQWKVMESQLKQMIGSGGQAERLILETKKSADAADMSAKAAKVSSDALARIERAWIFLDISLDGQLVHVTTAGMNRTGGRFAFRCRNVGKSPAWITDKILFFEIYNSGSPPKTFDIESLGRFQYGPEPMEPGADKTDHPSWETDGMPGVGKFTLVLGVVKYHDIFGDHITLCGYMLSPNHRELERIFGPNYNRYT